ncbi:type III secretion system stator protein SctL [Bradyrhizobium xenonodulans]|uniref:Type 3 secretion system stator protein n=1 Tax=Bradyrhizobium xenonodulans TaxID=2736875 RepID=A0ABY7MV09_9BRAD|nr:type III secretion system stator protein SctL [Bradyrhizobium xenonodulans]WBL81363.1 type III secretion system stator protein SctL [Bradyrhizobium xenonodulans]
MAVDQAQAAAAPRLHPLGPVVRAEELGIWGEAQTALDAAERHRERMRRWALAVYQRERQRGRDEGLATGREEAAELIAATSARANTYLRRLEQDLPQLVLDVIDDLLGHFEPGDLLARAVRHALTRLKAAGEVRLRVTAEQSARLRAALDELRENGPAVVEIEIDPGLKANQCVLVSEFGNIELGLESQLTALRKGLLAEAARGGFSGELP